MKLYVNVMDEGQSRLTRDDRLGDGKSGEPYFQSNENPFGPAGVLNF